MATHPVSDPAAHLEGLRGVELVGGGGGQGGHGVLGAAPKFQLPGGVADGAGTVGDDLVGAPGVGVHGGRAARQRLGTAPQGHWRHPQPLFRPQKEPSGVKSPSKSAQLRERGCHKEQRGLQEPPQAPFIFF